jgi:formylglycine-generating enzyme required for sulfatase activity
MLIQRAGTGTLPPPGFTPPPFALLASLWTDSSLFPPPSTPHAILGPTTVSLGHDDPESRDHDSATTDVVDAAHEFGWDNESPKRDVRVERVKVDWRPVTNGEFGTFFWERGEVDMPASWVEVEGDVMVSVFVFVFFFFCC